MKKILPFLIMCTFALRINAQIVATVKQALTLHDAINNTDYFLKSGDSIKIYGYKKKGDIYNFVIVTDKDAQILSLNGIPFNVDEKQLKTLPNALSDDMKIFISRQKEEILANIKLKRKQDALDGRIYMVTDKPFLLDRTSDSVGEISKGDTLHILGYSYDGVYYKYALYANNALGVFKTLVQEDALKQLNTKFLPSVEDTDIRIALKQMESERKQRQKEYNDKYRSDALEGKIKGVMSYEPLRDEQYNNSPFNRGDSVSVVGYSKKDYKYYYALYSTEGAGVYYSISDNAIRGPINWGLLPRVDSPEVLEVIKRQKAVADSLAEIQIDSLKKVLDKTRLELIDLYAKNSPVIIKDISWTSNSAGRIEVELKVTNCSLETIKYISFQGYFTNPVGDRCRNEIGGSTIWKARGIGPIGPRPTKLENYEERYYEFEGSYKFDNTTFYSRIADTFKLSSVTIQYMSGKTITLSGPSLDKHIRY